MSKYDDILDSVKNSASYQLDNKKVQEKYNIQKARLDAILEIADEYLDNPCAATQFNFKLSNALEEKGFFSPTSAEEDFFWNEALKSSEDCERCGYSYREEDLYYGICEDCLDKCEGCDGSFLDHELNYRNLCENCEEREIEEEEAWEDED